MQSFHDNLILCSYASALQTIALFGASLKRLPGLIAAIVFLI